MLSRAAVVFLLLATTAGAVARSAQIEHVPPRASFDAFPLRIGGWHGVTNAPFDGAVLEALGVDDYVSRTYYDADRAGVSLYVGYYASQAQGDTIHSPLNCLPGLGWEPVSKSVLRLIVPGTPRSEFTSNRYVVQKGRERHVVLYWYQGRGRIVANEYWSKLLLMADAVRLGRTDAAIVRVIAPIQGPGQNAVDDAERKAVSFVQAIVPHLDPYVPR
jgi:EpsI family protein